MAIQVLSRLQLPVTPVFPTDVARKMDLAAGGGVNYSTVPIDTLVEWVEGSPVYRKVVFARSGNTIGTNNQIATAAGFIALIDIRGYVVGQDQYRYPLGYSAGTAYFAVMMHQDGTVYEQHGISGFNNCDVVLIVDYIPDSGVITTWDAALTVYDSALGGTRWDVI